MEKLLQKLLVDAKKNKKALNYLKAAAVTCQNYELGSILRDIEKKQFPETAEDAASKKRCKEIQVALNMVGIVLDEKASYEISETIKVFNKNKGKFSIDDATKIAFRSNYLYNY